MQNINALTGLMKSALMQANGQVLYLLPTKEKKQQYMFLKETAN
jgi:hypothetical protein